MNKDGLQIAVQLKADGLFDSKPKLLDWKKLCQPRLISRTNSDHWTRAKLPEIAPWFESRLFGGLKSNHPLEEHFSTYGRHVEEEQSSRVKESIVRLTLGLKDERDARRAPEMRVEKKSEKAKAKYAEQRTARQASGKTEELGHDSTNRKQLRMRGEQLQARMEAVSAREVCPEIGLDVKQFEKERNKSHDLLVKRELKAQEGEMREKRKRGRRSQTSDAYGQARKLKEAMASEAYLKAVEAKNAAEDAMAEALKAATVIETGDADPSDVEDEASDEDDSGLEFDYSSPPAKQRVRAHAGARAGGSGAAGKRKRAL